MLIKTADNKRGPWQFISRQSAYKNPWMEVFEDQVVRPDGQPGIYGHLIVADGASILAFNENNDVYLVKEYKYPLEEEIIETVSGGLEAGESHLDTAKCELQEETGLTAKNWQYLGFVNPYTAYMSAKNHLYLARDLQLVGAKPDASEQLTIINVPFRQALNWALNGKIRHSGSVALILKAFIYLTDSSLFTPLSDKVNGSDKRNTNV